MQQQDELDVTAAEAVARLARKRAELFKTPKPGAPLDVAQAVAALDYQRKRLRLK